MFKKLFLMGTALTVAGTALAFGGVFSHGNKSTTYKGGVNAIGVHFGGEKKTTDITADTPACPEHSAWNGTACECKLGWLTNESGECTCPEERQCGDTCCGEGNICESGKCCFTFHENWWDKEANMCCNPNESLAYSTSLNDGEGGCCPPGTISYIESVYGDGDDYEWVGCCDGVVLEREKNEEEGWTSYGCCPVTSTYINEFGDCCGGDNEEWEDIEGHQRCHEAGATVYCNNWNVWYNSCQSYEICPPNKVVKHFGEFEVCCNEDEEVYCAVTNHWLSKCEASGCCPQGETCETMINYDH